jgi:hypothetical protein
MHSEIDPFFLDYATRRWFIRAALSIPVLLLILVGGGCVMDRSSSNEDRDDPDGRLLAGQTRSDGASPSAGPECGWKSMKPYLESLLKDVGGPEGVGLGGDTMNPTQNGIRLSPPEYEGRLNVFVTSDNEEDPENRNTQGMNLVTHHDGFAVYRAQNPESDVLIAADDDTAWTMSLVGYPSSGTVDWADRGAPVDWMLQAIDNSNARPPPL